MRKDMLQHLGVMITVALLFILVYYRLEAWTTHHSPHLSTTLHLPINMVALSLAGGIGALVGFCIARLSYHFHVLRTSEQHGHDHVDEMRELG